MMFAEAIDNVPSEFWKNFCLSLIALLVVAGIIVGIWSSTRKPVSTRLNDDPAIKVEKQSKRFNHDLSEQRYTNHEVRLNAHDAELDSLWTEMRREDRDIREKNSTRFEEINLSLGRIEGALGTQPKKP